MPVTPYSGVLGRTHATHLLRRCTFHYDKTTIDQFAQLTAPQAVAQLMQPYTPHLEQPIDPRNNGSTWINPPIDLRNYPTPGFRLNEYVLNWFVDEARRNPGIQHKMVLFLHNTFTISVEGVGNSAHHYDYLQLLQFYALGNIKTLARKIVVDYVMLRYLDNRLNVKTNPNENFSREYFELFTVLRGEQVSTGDYSNYTEDDVKTAAKVLTGFTTANREAAYLDPDTNIYRGRARFNNHDTTDKQFSRRFHHEVITGAASEEDMWRELQDFVDMIFHDFDTARNYVRRLYRYFFSNSISEEVDEHFIAPLAHLLFKNGYDIQPVLAAMFSSAHFYDSDPNIQPEAIMINGSIVKSPIDLVLPTLTFFEVEIPDPATEGMEHYESFYQRGILDDMFLNAGMDLLKPPSVAGYPPYYQQPDFQQAWFSSSTIIPRYNLQDMLIRGRRYINNQPVYAQVDMVAFVDQQLTDPSDAESIVQFFVDYLFCQAPDADRFAYFYEDIFLDGLSPINWRFEWNNYKNGTTNDEAVRIALNRLFTALLYSQEYQIM